MEQRYIKSLKSLVYTEKIERLANRQFYKKWLKTYSENGCKENICKIKKDFILL